jgi:hypothetical protein
MLAALPVHRVDYEDIANLIERALAEVDQPYYEPQSTAAQESALAAMARRTLAGDLEPRTLAASTHGVFGHASITLAERLAELDDVYDTVEYISLTVAEVDAEVIIEARRIAERELPAGA